MSPVNDDVMVFVVLAVGLRPVMAPVDPRNGNIDVRAVLTTHIYGMPDDADELRTRCDRIGVPLLEDAAHAIGRPVGERPIGTFGELRLSAWASMRGATGGEFPALEDPEDRKAIEHLRDGLLEPRGPP
ncbi:DegT/DnrJ/EryC1/StrS family aminotransferase [Streptomyces sp. DT190]|uniref:DegT/DnrJ/EryC1/StrS family aminotransferase n=1 Tax=unclassified Streptomyces TaxID=2593676 RepID=UPI003CEB47D2